MPRPIECPRVMVEWRDVISDNKWEEVSNELSPPLIVSVGWQVDRTKRIVTLAADVAGEAGTGESEVNRRISIPMVLVERILSNDGKRVLYKRRRS